MNPVLDDNLLSVPQLIARARTGDEAAFDALARRYRAAVLAVTFSRTGDRDEAEDLAQLANVPVATVAGRTHRAREQIRRVLVRISANLDSDFGVVRTAVSVIPNGLGAQATPDEYAAVSPGDSQR